MSLIGRKIGAIRRMLGRPDEELGRVERAVRFIFDLVGHCTQQLKRDQAGQMAAALTYRTIFSLVPVVVLMLLVFRAFGGFEQVQVDLQDRIYSYLGLSSIALPPADVGESTEAVAEEEGRSSDELGEVSTEGTTVSVVPDGVGSDAEGSPVGTDEQVDSALRSSIQKIIGDLTRQASGANFGSIGAVGLLLLIWGALALVVTVEQSFNRVYNCSVGRPWHLRVAIYWAVLTLGPVLLFVSLYVAEAVVGRIEAFVGGGVGVAGAERSGLLGSLSGLAALGSSWLLLFLSYLLLPNTRVRFRPALIGSLLAALLWECGKWGFKLYVTRAVSYSILYGTLGLIPLFLLWVYLTWLIVLFGLEVTYTLQAMRGRVFEKEAAALRASDQTDPAWLIPVVTMIATGFRTGKAVTLDDLAVALQLPGTAVDRLTGALEGAGLIHRIREDQSGGGAFVLAKSAKSIRVADLLSMSHSASNIDRVSQPGARVGAELLRGLALSQQESVGEKTLEQVMEADGAPPRRSGCDAKP